MSFLSLLDTITVFGSLGAATFLKYSKYFTWLHFGHPEVFLET